MKNFGKIAVLAGGSSSEREISLKSGHSVFDALKRKKLNVSFVDVKSNSIEEIRHLDADIAFIALHGRFGEDGTVQAILEDLNIGYTGSGVKASKLALDKIASREIFISNNLKSPEYKAIEKNCNKNDIINKFTIPFVIKPQHEGSSIGLSVVSDKALVDRALKEAFDYDDVVLIEEYIDGKELTVGILDDKALPVIEISMLGDIYDFNAKYVDSKTEYVVPANIKEEAIEKAKDCAVKAHKALGCRDFSRVDMRMDKSGNIYILEINTIPGMTERSLLPKAAQEAGINFDDLCIKLIELAHKRKGI